jgi:hypothetical protein
MGHGRHRPPAKGHRFRSSSRMGPRRNLRGHARRGGIRLMEAPERYIIDSNRPQHHAVSAQHKRARWRPKHRRSAITAIADVPRTFFYFRLEAQQSSTPTPVFYATTGAHIPRNNQCTRVGNSVSRPTGARVGELNAHAYGDCSRSACRGRQSFGLSTETFVLAADAPR